MIKSYYLHGCCDSVPLNMHLILSCFLDGNLIALPPLSGVVEPQFACCDLMLSGTFLLGCGRTRYGLMRLSIYF